MKKLKFIIIGYPNKNTLDLVAEIKSRKHLVSVVPLKEIIFEFAKNTFKASWNNVNLNKYDVFIFRAYNIHVDEARILAEKLISDGKIVLDAALGKQFFQNKLFDASKTTQFGLNHPQTFMALSPASYEKIASKIKFPVVIKPCAGQKGKGIKKIETRKDFLTFFRKNPRGYLVQEFFDLKSDLRVFVVGNKVLGAYRRFIPKDDFRSTRKGVLAAKVTMTPMLKKIALTATKAMGYDIAGIDLFEHNNRYYIFEVNFSPQWQKFKEVTGINPAKDIVDLAIKKYRKRA